MKNTVFTEKHIALGAKMAPFAGYNMPIQYKGINEEHATVREGVGVFDVSHMGEIWVCGPKALPFMQYVSSNDASVLFPGKAQYTCFPNGKGGIVDDFILYCFSTEKYLLAVNAANIEKDWNHLCAIAPKFGLEVGKELVNASDATCQLAIQGPKAMEVMQKLCKEDILSMEYYTFKQLEVAGIPDAILSTTGYTGSGGCEVYVPNEYGDQLWKAVFEAGEPFGIQPIGLGARDTLRLEMGYPLYGHELNEDITPVEAGFGAMLKLDSSNREFVGSDALRKRKPGKQLIGLKLDGRRAARAGMTVLAAGKKAGTVTSGAFAPSLNCAVAMALMETGTDAETFEIDLQRSVVTASKQAFPFYPDGTARKK